MRKLKENTSLELYASRLVSPEQLEIEIAEEKNKTILKALRLACQVIEHNDPIGNDYQKLMDDFIRMANNHGIK